MNLPLRAKYYPLAFAAEKSNWFVQMCDTTALVARRIKLKEKLLTVSVGNLAVGNVLGKMVKEGVDVES